MKPLPKLPSLPNIEENKRRRALLKALWLSNPAVKQDIKARCSQLNKDGFFFWAEHFCWTWDDEKPPDKREQPLVLWEFQKDLAGEIIDEIIACLQDETRRWNCAADKARGMAATFTGLLVLQWFAQFHGISSIITSKTEEDVDKLNDMNSPFQRIRFQLDKHWELYPWLLPDAYQHKNKEHNKNKLIAFQNGGQISGFAPVAKKFRQGRAFIWFGDEFAFVDEDYECWEAAAGTVRVRMVFSTPKDPICKYHRLIFREDNEQIRVFELDWWLRPDRVVGAYWKEDGTLSSPWMDNIIANNNRQVVAREYLRDHNEAVGGRVFYMFRPESKVRGLRPDKRIRQIYRIWDPGLYFGVCWAQKDYYNTFLALEELVLNVDDVAEMSDTLLNRIAEAAIKITELNYHEYEILDIGDPYGSRRQLSSQDKCEYDLLYDKFKIRVQSQFMYNIPSHLRVDTRIEILSDLMARDIEETGKPGFLIDPDKCPIMIKAIEGKYRRKVEPNGVVQPEIIKVHPYTEVCDNFGMAAIKMFHKKPAQSEAPVVVPKQERVAWRRAARSQSRSQSTGRRFGLNDLSYYLRNN